jgi:hypothetical protein
LKAAATNPLEKLANPVEVSGYSTRASLAKNMRFRGIGHVVKIGDSFIPLGPPVKAVSLDP